MNGVERATMNVKHSSGNTLALHFRPRKVFQADQNDATISYNSYLDRYICGTCLLHSPAGRRSLPIFYARAHFLPNEVRALIRHTCEKGGESDRRVHASFAARFIAAKVNTEHPSMNSVAKSDPHALLKPISSM